MHFSTAVTLLPSILRSNHSHVTETGCADDVLDIFLPFSDRENETTSNHKFLQIHVRVKADQWWITRSSGLALVRGSSETSKLHFIITLVRWHSTQLINWLGEKVPIKIGSMKFMSGAMDAKCAKSKIDRIIGFTTSVSLLNCLVEREVLHMNV